MVQKSRIHEALCLSIFQGVAAGMAHLAAERIVHRDLAARNILLDTNFVPKVADFGMSRKVSEGYEGVTNSNFGPIIWMSPENLSTKEYSEKVHSHPVFQV